MHILFTAPAYWPAIAFGGPIWMARELNARSVAAGHVVEVVTTSLTQVASGKSFRSTLSTVDGVKVHYLATPLHYRWTGFTPSLPSWLRKQRRPDVVHIFGYRDVVGTLTALWCRKNRIPYVFEPLGMLRPRLRKVRLKRSLDKTVFSQIVRDAAAVVATSQIEVEEMVAAGIARERIVVRGNGFPEPRDRTSGHWLRQQLGLAADALIVLSVGRIAVGKGIEHLLSAARALPEVHVVIAGPDNADGTLDRIRAAQAEPGMTGRVHVLPPSDADRPFRLYSEADVFVLPSEGESFGMVAAEAAACGVPTIVTDRCGVSELFAKGGALVIPYGERWLRDAIVRIRDDEGGLRRSLAHEARVVAAEFTWQRIAERQTALYAKLCGSRREGAHGEPIRR